MMNYLSIGEFLPPLADSKYGRRWGQNKVEVRRYLFDKAVQNCISKFVEVCEERLPTSQEIAPRNRIRLVRKISIVAHPGHFPARKLSLLHV